DALRNPYDERITVRKDFLRSPFLDGLITDTHYNNPDRRGRHIVFLARMLKDYNVGFPKGIGIDERTVVCIDEKGIARVFGRSYAYFIAPSQPTTRPEVCESGKPLTWNTNGGRALRAYEVAGNSQGTGYFNVSAWKEGEGGSWRWYSSENGVLKMIKD
ncbi:MAG: cyanophycinase, partial [Flammeovirgaceae bacterium]|nr:cyanophycinase [Flammeovirgaceae bacterium]MDW8289026.1 cyanophycinase [Flammeovirgaceae bacterium]